MKINVKNKLKKQKIQQIATPNKSSFQSLNEKYDAK